MKTKAIEQIVSPPPFHWVGNGFKVHNFFPGLLDMQRMSPFFLLDYNARMYFPPSQVPRGVDTHPHRGIETVTVAYRGKVAHHDSAGNGGVIGEGDLQWMTAGGGILHKEYHEEEFNRKGGDFHVVQLWVNLPKKYKMTEPKYQALIHEAIPKYTLPDQAGTVEVVAGEYKKLKGIAETFSPIELYNIRLNKGGQAEMELPEYYNTALLVVEGEVRINDSQTAPTDSFVLFKNQGEIIRLEAGSNATLLVMSGKPLNEPISAAGPFVMNTRTELHQAFLDYEDGKFGKIE